MLVLEDFVDFHRTSQLRFFGINDWVIDLNYCDVELFSLEMNWDHSITFQAALK